jgi:NADH-quinone oxidoreductase subunit M
MDLREMVALAPLILFVLWIGVYPVQFLDFMHPTVQHLLDRVNVTSVAQETNIIKLLMEVIR